MTAPQVKAAQEAYEAGLCVIPPREDGSKRPDGEWKQYQAERPDRDQMNAWYGGPKPKRGVGVIVGAVSGHVEMVEMEGAAIAEGYYPVLLERLSEANLDDVWERIVTGYSESTPRGGFHALLRTEAVAGAQKLATRPMTADEFEASLTETEQTLYADNPEKRERAFQKATVLLAETKGEGGFTICAPTNGAVHPDGRAWSIISGGFGTIATVSCEERDGIYEVLRSLTEKRPKSEDRIAEDSATILSRRDGEAPSDSGTIRPPGSVRLTPTAGFEGESSIDAYNNDPNAHANVVALMQSHGWTVDQVVAGVTHLTRPGKDDGTSATVGHYTDPPMLHVFTSSAGDFEPDETYSPFGVYEILEHGGDSRAAARQLSEDGYGTPHQVATLNVGGHEPGDEPVEYTLPADRELWQEDDGTGIPPELNDHIYHGPIGDILRFWEGRTEPVTATIAVELFARISAHIGTKAHYRLPDGGWMGMNWWGLLIGDTSLSRKGTAADVAARSMPPGFDIRSTNGVGSGEKLLELVSNVERDDDGKIASGHTDQRLLVDEPEFGAILTRSEQTGSTLSPTMRKLYDGVPVNHEVKSGSTHADGYHLCIAASITPAELRTQLSDVAIANGFANRFQMFAGLDSIDLPLGGTGIPADELDRLRHTLGSNIGAALRDGGELAWSERAAATFADVYPGLKRAKGSLTVRSILARSTDHLIKLAGIYAICDGTTVIGIDHLLAASAWVAYSNETARWVYSVSDADKWTRRILEAVRAQPGVPLNVSADIHRYAFSHDRPLIGEVTARIDKLEAAGWVHKFKVSPAGRGRPSWYVVATKKTDEKGQK